MTTYAWCSFATEEAFLGACVVEMGDDDSLIGAAIRTHALGINPGGELAGGLFDADEIPAEHLDRLVTTKPEAQDLEDAITPYVTSRP